MAVSALFTLIVSVDSLARSFLGIDSRSSVDRRLRRWSRWLLRQVCATYSVHNRQGFELLPGKPYIIMCNHSSLYDIPLSLIALPGSIRMLVKKELMQVPIWGRAMRSCEFVSIDRHNRSQALKDLETAEESMQSGIVLWIAPEGTRSRDGNLLPFKNGGFYLAINTKATIIPVGFRGARAILPAKSSDFAFGQHVEVHIGEPVDAGQYDLDAKEELKKEVERQIRVLVGQNGRGKDA